ncbi:25849_t:CDS:1, partial [Dentiscutata erythropus]
CNFRTIIVGVGASAWFVISIVKLMGFPSSLVSSNWWGFFCRWCHQIGGVFFVVGVVETVGFLSSLVSLNSEVLLSSLMLSNQ